MDDLTEEMGSLNPYARIFFSLWGLIVFLIVCFRLTGPAGGQQTAEQQRTESLESNPGRSSLAGLSRLKQGVPTSDDVSGAERTFTVDKSLTQLRPLP